MFWQNGGLIHGASPLYMYILLVSKSFDKLDKADDIYPTVVNTLKIIHSA